jgi:hypothetical protein
MLTVPKVKSSFRAISLKADVVAPAFLLEPVGSVHSLAQPRSTQRHGRVKGSFVSYQSFMTAQATLHDG